MSSREGNSGGQQDFGRDTVNESDDFDLNDNAAVGDNGESEVTTTRRPEMTETNGGETFAARTNGPPEAEVNEMQGLAVWDDVTPAVEELQTMEGDKLNSKNEKFNLRIAGSSDRGCICLVCFGEFVDGEDFLLQLTCSHRFHGLCIFKWFEVKPNCPVCQVVFN